MSVRTCPSCGSEYLASVERCVDCDVELVDLPVAEEAEADAQATLVDGDQLTYELIGYANETKVYLDGMLTQAGVPHVWQAGDLVVRAVDRSVVDGLVEEASALEDPLEPDDEIVFEVVGFDEGQRSDLDAMLQTEDIEHSWDEQGDLVVRAADEDRAAAILDRIDMADELTAEEVEASGDEDTEDDSGGDDDGLAAQDTMSDLFVVVDKLMKDPDDGGLHASLAASARRIGDLGTPFGFSKTNWSDLQARASALVELTAADERDDELIKTDARALRELLHQYV